MAFPSVTYFYNNGTKILADQLNTNNTDLLSGITDGTKNFNIYDFACDSASGGNITITETSTITNLSVEIAGSFDDDVEFNAKTNLDVLALNIDPEAFELDVSAEITPSKTSIVLRATEFNDGDTNDVTINSTNNRFQITEDGETVAEVVTLSNGTYTGTQMATEVQTKMNAALTQTYVVSYSGGANGTYTISSVGNPFTLWVTGGLYIAKCSLPLMGFRLGGTSGTDTDADSHTSDVAYKVGYYRKLDTINLDNLKSGSLLYISLQRFSDSASYVPITIDELLLGDSANNSDIVLMQNSKLLLQVTKSNLGLTKTVSINFSANFQKSNY